MPIRFELHNVQHPFKLCGECNDALGTNCVTLDPGHPRSQKFYVCNEHLGSCLKDLGEGLIKLLEQEKGEE